MVLTRRLALSLSLVLCGMVSFAMSAAADLMPAGNYHITTVVAETHIVASVPSFTVASVFVEDTVTQADPRVGPSSITTVVDVGVSWIGDGTSGSGCSVLANPSDFTFGSGLSGAALHTTFTNTLQPCNSFESLVPPVAVDATWTATGSTGSGRTNTHYDCGGYTSESLAFGSGSGANSSFSISALTGSFTDSEAGLFSSDEQLHAQGTAQSTCPPAGSKGAGPGPQAPGNYTTTSQFAGFGQSPTDQSDPQISMSVNQFSKVSNPQGGAPSTTSETDLFLDVSGSTACFVIDSPAFTISSDLSSASLHMSLTADSKSCDPSFGSFPFLPTDVNVTWSATGLVGTTKTDGQGFCGGSLTGKAFLIDSFDTATATATLSYFPGTAFTGSQSQLGKQDHRFQILGVSRCPGGR